MDARAAFVAESLADLEAKLQALLDGNTAPGIYRGDARKNAEVLGLLTSDEGFRGVVDGWFGQQRADKLLELWVKGLPLDWKAASGAARPRRVSLPTYPFARESYWVPRLTPGARLLLTPRLHPLVHENTSDLAEQRYRTRLTGEEFFLADHRVDGRRWLPAVAYLEMAREAVTRAAGDVVALRDVVWERPIAVGDEPVEIHAGIAAEDGGGIAFEIYGDGDVVYARGTATVGTRADAPRVDTAPLASRYAAGAYTAADCYTAFDAMGIDFGAGHRGLEGCRRRRRHGHRARVASRGGGVIARPVPAPPEHAGCRAAVDGRLYPGRERRARAADRALPFALDTAEIYAPTPAEGWVVARRIGGEAAGLARYDIELCDGEGRVAVRLRGLSTRRATARPSRRLNETAAPIAHDELHRDVPSAVIHTQMSWSCRSNVSHADAQFAALDFDSILLIAFADQLQRVRRQGDARDRLGRRRRTTDAFLVEQHHELLAERFARVGAAATSFRSRSERPAEPRTRPDARA